MGRTSSSPLNVEIHARTENVNCASRTSVRPSSCNNVSMSVWGHHQIHVPDAAPDLSFDHEGINPQRICDRFLVGSTGFCRITSTGCVGATLYRGVQSSSSEIASKCSSMICFLRDSRCRPHMECNYCRCNRDGRVLHQCRFPTSNRAVCKKFSPL